MKEMEKTKERKKFPKIFVLQTLKPQRETEREKRVDERLITTSTAPSAAAFNSSALIKTNDLKESVREREEIN